MELSLKLTTVLILLLLVPSFFTVSAITVEPRKITFPAPHSKPYHGSFEIKNGGQVTEKIVIKQADWSMNINGRISFHGPGTLDRSINPEIRFSPQNFKIEAKSTKIIDFRVSPTKGKAKSRWGVFLIRTIREKRDRETEGVNIGVKVQHAVTLYQKGDIKAKSGEITRLAVKEQKGKVEISIRFRNNCEAYLRPSGALKIKTTKGRTLKIAQLKSSLVLPAQARKFKIKLEKSKLGMDGGDYVVLAVIDFEGDHKTAARRKFRASNN